MMNLSTICRRVSLRETVSNIPVYTGAIEASGGLSLLFRRWATKKSAGSTKNGRDSNPKFLGVKKFGGEVYSLENDESINNMQTCESQGDEASGGLSLLFRRWATKKSAGSTKNGRDSNPKFLGVKKFGGERVIPGNIIVRQRGTRFHPGDYVGMGKDHTLFAMKEGQVRFERHKLSGRKWVHVDPKEGHVLHPVYTAAAAAATEAADGSQLC